MRFAGFWIRFVAWFIDTVVMWVAGLIILFPLTLPYYRELLDFLQYTDWSAESLAAMPQGSPLGSLASIVLAWLYGSLLESSRWQATLGKMAVGIRVTDYQGRRISFARATGRHFAKWVSALICGIGYLMVAFTERKQGLHDMIAQTYVAWGSADGTANPPQSDIPATVE